MRLLIAIIGMLMLSSSAFAATESRQVGPYTVSFNVNTNMNYQVATPNPAIYPFATVYSVVVMTDNTTGASISIAEYKNITDSTLQVNEENTALRMALRGINATAPVERVIDGKNGYLISGVPFSSMSNMPSGLMFYHAQYWLDSNNSQCGPISAGTKLVDITSTYPRDATESILTSIHVATSQTQLQPPGTPPASEMPPASGMPPAQMVRLTKSSGY
jgi:hypothetical protein